MRLKIRHEATYSYDPPATRALANLRLTPRGDDGLFVHDWRIDISRDCRLQQAIDPFGNIMHRFSIEGPMESLTVMAEGTVETIETTGIVRGAVEKFPPEVFQRETPLTTADKAIAAFARESAEAIGADRLALLHELMAAVHGHFDFDFDVDHDTPRTSATAAEAFSLGHGTSQDLAHVFIAAARAIGIPARYVSGYQWRAEGPNDREDGHAWAEALVERLGWVGFDPCLSISPGEAYVRVAVGLDAPSAAPVRAAHYPGIGEKLAVRVSVADIGHNPG